MFRIFLFLFVFCYGCFEYEETILFRKMSSGTVEISYTVPLKKDSNESLIKFLPTSKEEILTSVKKKSNNNLLVRDFTFRELEKSETTDMYFKRKGKVSYKLDFEDPLHLEGVLIGTFSIKQKPRSLSVKRDFPNLTDNAILDSSAGEKKIISETSRLLKEGKIQFKVLFPKDSECSSNRGFIGLGNLVYQIPLQETLENPEAKTWEYKIRFF
ncbi:MAG: LIC11874 family lipoprotein [Leptospira bouyouniensis]|uniref:Lipoprotein n=1 Tax=Leptospira bouyouniensis TaxID=2484911 RepID=A0A7I0HQ86_9LEPT|nr:hypothetical protein [Leptospira bouyouniensis]TGK48339.1 hypothetical protein EHQ10_11470 [Leptospira bouyouniensis]TGL04310.1 hypothetical protein EHQ43_13065 [Leptospira bouyouniensis]TGM80724.1 hypothetical protein EHQ99_13820 [Leptospira bouyouniensis]